MKSNNAIFSIDFELWGYVLNGPFVPTHCINNEVVNKPRNLSTT